MPDANLVRWKAVFASFKDWHETGDPPEAITARQFAWMDPVQKNITATLFATTRASSPARKARRSTGTPRHIRSTKRN